MCDASDDSDRVVCPSCRLNETILEIDNVTVPNTRVVSTLQGSQWNPECKIATDPMRFLFTGHDRSVL